MGRKITHQGVSLPPLIVSLVVFLLLSKEGTGQPNLYLSLSFIVSNSYESHAEACQRVGLKPTARIIPFDLNATTAADISVAVLNYSSHTLEGCCASSLWCSDSSNSCFSQSYGLYYENYGWLSGNVDSKPVFTCVSATMAAGNPPVVTAIRQGVADYEWDFNTLMQKELYLYGSDYGFEENITAVSIAGQTCSEQEICSHVCASCGGPYGYDCPLDSECLQVSGSRRCFPYCAGPDDTSCPCNTKCVAVNFNYANTIIHVHLCAPESFSLSKNVCQGHEQQKIRCNAPHAKTTDIQNHLSSYNFSLSIGEEVTVGTLGTVIQSATTQFTCDVDEDCDDGNICTTSTCASNRCVFVDVIGCNSTSSSVLFRQTNFYYISYLETGKASDQADFDTYMASHGTLSSVSNEDDYPIDGPLSIGFEFPFYGERVNALAINPNGLISLTPVNPCMSYPGTIACMVFSTFTNVISPWFKDWNLVINAVADSNVYYLHQYSSDNDPIYGIASVDAFHVSYQNVIRYTNSDEQEIATDQNTFSTSMYSDGSVRFRFSKTDEVIKYTDFSGLWSSRASSDDESWQRNYKENVTQYIQAGNDVVFCPNFNTVVCASNTCVYPGDIYKMKMKQPSCIALSTTLSYVCRFAGIYIADATFDPIDGTISCTVPTLNDISYDSIITVDVDVITVSSNGAIRVSGVYVGAYAVTNTTYTTWEGLNRWKTDSTQLMVKYVENSLSCGCSPLSSKIGFVCDECNVCGGENSEKDCNGDCFGTAYIDSCGNCAGGLTGVIPSDQCDFDEYVVPTILDMQDVLTVLLGACLILCSFSGCLFIIRRNMDTRRIRMMTLLAQGRAVVENGRRGLTEEEISHVHGFKFELSEEIPHEEGGSLLEGATECSICLGEFVNGDECRRLPSPCSHTFHTACIDEWLKLSSACPLCKRSLRDLIPELRSADAANTGGNTSSSIEASPVGRNGVGSFLRRDDGEVELGSSNREIQNTMHSSVRNTFDVGADREASSGSPSVIVPVVTGIIDTSRSLSHPSLVSRGRVVDPHYQMQAQLTNSRVNGSNGNNHIDFLPIPTESPTDTSITAASDDVCAVTTTESTSVVSTSNNETRNLISRDKDEIVEL